MEAHTGTTYTSQGNAAHYVNVPICHACYRASLPTAEEVERSIRRLYIALWIAGGLFVAFVVMCGGPVALIHLIR
jgi:hypothetical protein